MPITPLALDRMEKLVVVQGTWNRKIGGESGKAATMGNPKGLQWQLGTLYTISLNNFL